MTAHPRARGERLCHRVGNLSLDGSSPRTRGTGWGMSGAKVIERLIPAHAGNGSAASPCSTARAAHPRARGERPATTSADPAATGSSPRTRGTEMRACLEAVLQRLIPAHAGNGCRGGPCAGCSPAHPRARGERRSASASPLGGAGSSPRTRGTVFPQPREKTCIFLVSIFHRLVKEPMHRVKAVPNPPCLRRAAGTARVAAPRTRPAPCD